MYLERCCSIEENAAAIGELIAVKGLYPDLPNSDLHDEQHQIEYKENNLQESGLYPDLTVLIKKNYFPVTLGKVCSKTDLNKLDTHSKKVGNKLRKNIKTDLTDGGSKPKPKPKAKVVLKKKNCNKIVTKKEKTKKEKRRTKRKHKHLRRGCKVLAFTIGLPITLPYLMMRTSPNKEDDDIEGEIDRMASSTASLFKRRGKKS